MTTELPRQPFRVLRAVLRASDSVMYAVLLLAALVTNAISPGFLALGHIGDLLLEASLVGFSALGEMLVLLLGDGNIDLSVGPVIILTSVVVSAVSQGQVHLLLPALLLATLLSGVVGLLNGIGVAVLRVPPLIMTLATASMTEGGYFLYTRGFASGSTPTNFNNLWITRVGFLPGSALIWLALALLLAAWLHWGKGGRELYLAGANPKAARITGISLSLVTIRSYVLSALLAMLSGLALTGYIGLPTMDYGTNETMAAIAAAVLGGTTFEGGRGTVRGVVGGTLLLTVLQAILTILNVSDAGKLMLDGMVIIAVMVAYQWRVHKTR